MVCNYFLLYTCCSIKLQRISRKHVTLSSILLDCCSHKFLTCNWNKSFWKNIDIISTCANGKAVCVTVDRTQKHVALVHTRLKYLRTPTSMHERIWISLVVWSFVSIEFKIMAIFLMRHREVHRASRWSTIQGSSYYNTTTE